MTAATITGQNNALLDAPVNSFRLSHYQIRSRLGEGGFGEVYEAWDTKLCRSVAIKRLKNILGAVHTDSLITDVTQPAKLEALRKLGGLL